MPRIAAQYPSGLITDAIYEDYLVGFKGGDGLGNMINWQTYHSADWHNKTKIEVQAIATELGILPRGWHEDVGARLNTINPASGVLAGALGQTGGTEQLVAVDMRLAQDLTVGGDSISTGLFFAAAPAGAPAIIASGSIIGQGDIVASGSLLAPGVVIGNGWISSSNWITASGDLTSGGNIESTGGGLFQTTGVVMGPGYIQSSNWIESSGNIDSGGTITAATNVVASGDVSIGGGLKRTITPITTNHAVNTVDGILDVDATSAPVTISLPAVAIVSGIIMDIGKTDATANQVILDPDGVETINGRLVIALTQQYERVVIYSNATSWGITSSGVY